MTMTAERSILSRLAPIDLARLNDCAALQTRIDRKYLLPIHEVARCLSKVDSDTKILEIADSRAFNYQSVYFDTPDLITYLLAARRRRRRFKVRTRTYVDSAQCWLEVKTRGARGSTVKNRIRYELGDNATIDPGRNFVDLVLAQQEISESHDLTFTPTLITRYRRSTLYLPRTASRVTIDTDLTWQDSSGQCLGLSGLAIVETKNGSTASGMDRLLWSSGHRPVRISKYATGLAALRPDLPATPWRRTLRRHFVTAEPPEDQETVAWQIAS